MKELKCPKCGNVFTVDESDYADIVNQVKTADFDHLHHLSELRIPCFLTFRCEGAGYSTVLLHSF